MSLKWDGKFKKAEEINEWGWWALFGVIVVMEILFLLKIFGKI